MYKPNGAHTTLKFFFVLHFFSRLICRSSKPRLMEYLAHRTRRNCRFLEISNAVDEYVGFGNSLLCRFHGMGQMLLNDWAGKFSTTSRVLKWLHLSGTRIRYVHVSVRDPHKKKKKKTVKYAHVRRPPNAVPPRQPHKWCKSFFVIIHRMIMCCIVIVIPARHNTAVVWVLCRVIVVTWLINVCLVFLQTDAKAICEGDIVAAKDPAPAGSAGPAASCTRKALFFIEATKSIRKPDRHTRA
jgi:hypothetical protein